MRSARRLASLRVIVSSAWTFVFASALGAQHRPLAPTDVADITTLLMLEDRRQFDSTTLARMLHAAHPEVRRRAALSVGRIVNPRGRTLLRDARGDADTSVAATVVFATGQLHDTTSIAWFESLLSSGATPPTVATEAAFALGKIPHPEARAVLARFLTSASTTARWAPAVGEALLSIGRQERGDLAPVLRWTTSPNEEIRWRATWALFRTHDPAGVGELVRLTSDKSATVRNWAVRGLTAAQVDSGHVDRSLVAARLSALMNDPDRTVRTEAVRVLPTYSDSVSWALVATAVFSRDSWLAISAAEGLARLRDRAALSTPFLVAAMGRDRSSAVRVTALTSLRTLAPSAAVPRAEEMARDTSIMCRVAAVQFLRTLGNSAKDLLSAMVDDPAPAVSSAARQAVQALNDTSPAAGRAGAGRGTGRAAGAGSGAAGGRGPVVRAWRTEQDYQHIVERWIVPDYDGAKRPVAEWKTARGTFELELYPGDAPIAVDDFVRLVGSGGLVGAEFSRVVPDFVAQQRGIVDTMIVRDEVNRNHLTRANLSWASSGLDTGRPGYTLGNTPQPHNEGGFTSMGRVSRGMDVVDRLELGDRVLSARMISTGR